MKDSKIIDFINSYPDEFYEELYESHNLKCWCSAFSLDIHSVKFQDLNLAP